MGWWLDLMVFEVFSNLNDSVIFTHSPSCSGVRAGCWAGRGGGLPSRAARWDQAQSTRPGPGPRWEQTLSPLFRAAVSPSDSRLPAGRTRSPGELGNPFASPWSHRRRPRSGGGGTPDPFVPAIKIWDFGPLRCLQIHKLPTTLRAGVRRFAGPFAGFFLSGSVLVPQFPLASGSVACLCPQPSPGHRHRSPWEVGDGARHPTMGAQEGMVMPTPSVRGPQLWWAPALSHGGARSPPAAEEGRGARREVPRSPQRSRTAWRCPGDPPSHPLVPTGCQEGAGGTRGWGWGSEGAVPTSGRDRGRRRGHRPIPAQSQSLGLAGRKQRSVEVFTVYKSLFNWFLTLVLPSGCWTVTSSFGFWVQLQPI